MIRFHSLFNLLVLLWLCNFNAVQASPPEDAVQAFLHGYYEQAIVQWQNVLATTQDTRNRLDIQLALARAYRRLGAYEKTLDVINTTLPIAQQYPTYHSLLLNELSKLRLSQGEKWREPATLSASRAIEIAQKVKNPLLLATVLNHWGNLLTAEGDYEGAQTAYSKALSHLDSSKKVSPNTRFSTAEIKDLYGKILINKIETTFLLDLETAYQYDDKKIAFKTSIATLEQALQASQNWQDAYSQVLGLVTLSQAAQKIQAQFNQPLAQLTNYAYQASIMAKRVADRLGNPATKAYANGQLGHLYEQAKRYDEALFLTRQAVFFAQQTREPSLLYFWQWQLGRILKAQGNNSGAITAYQQAVEILRPIRAQVATTGYFNITKSFREKIAPVYFELADLLLQEATTTSTASHRDKLLRQARETIEFFKEAELQDYFQSDCVTFGNECTDLGQILDAQTAVLYPIVLPDRLELLLQRADGLVQATSPIRSVALRDKIASFLSPLRRHPFSDIARDTSTSDDKEASQTAICTLSAPRGISQQLEKLTQTFIDPAQTLYQWLIEPLASQLHDIKTLVVVPDGVLRTIPFAALHDGSQFLVQKHALVLTPGLCLSKPQQILRQRDNTVLLGGLSASVQGFSSLPCAGNELNTIQGLFDIKYKPLLNEGFTLPKLKNALNKSGYSIVHLASHGQFSGNLKNTFILTYDGKLSMDRLERLMSLATIKGKPVELLTLSACETAVGDDRAALGLAGVALKAGVKSALASLWKVDDAATQAIVIEFYRQLRDPTISKAIALQNAQKMMLNNKNYVAYQHPYFWSAFLLIGNWL